MELREIEVLLAKLGKIGVGSCETCNKQLRIDKIDVYNGVYLCPDCLRRVSQAKSAVIELKS
jgi:RNA polymerase-binding transcription factor DksA